MKILLLGNSETIKAKDKRTLKQDRISIESVISSIECKSLLKAKNYDCVIVDQSVANGNSDELIRFIQSNSITSGIMVTGSGDIDAKVHQLNNGADDYLTQPYHIDELKARLNAIVRRTKYFGQKEIVFEEITIDTQSMNVTVSGQEIQLTKTEYQLLVNFIGLQNKVVKRDDIVKRIWGSGEEAEKYNDTIYTHINNLKKKLKSVGCNDYFYAKYGVGYKFTKG